MNCLNLLHKSYIAFFRQDNCTNLLHESFARILYIFFRQDSPFERELRIHKAAVFEQKVLICINTNHFMELEIAPENLDDATLPLVKSVWFIANPRGFTEIST